MRAQNLPLLIDSKLILTNGTPYILQVNKLETTVDSIDVMEYECNQGLLIKQDSSYSIQSGTRYQITLK